MTRVSEHPTEERRDLDNIIKQRNSQTTIEALRKTYGADFARGYSGDAKLDTVLSNSGAKTLREYLKR
jgi:hypothetical protein